MVAAARDIARESGLDAVAVRAVAAACQVSIGTVINVCGSRDCLVADLLEWELHRRADVTLAPFSRDEGSAIEKLRDGLLATLDIDLDRPRYKLEVMTATLLWPEPVDRGARIFARIRAVVDQAVRREGLPFDDLFGIMLGFHGRLVKGLAEGALDRRLAEERLRAFADGLAAAAPAPLTA